MRIAVTIPAVAGAAALLWGIYRSALALRETFASCNVHAFAFDPLMIIGLALTAASIALSGESPARAALLTALLTATAILSTMLLAAALYLA